jgi:hypothetical protein
MNSSLISRLASFGAACAMTLALLVGVTTMSTTQAAPVWIAKSAACPSA